MGQALDSGVLGRLSGREWAVPPFGALILKPFPLGQNWRKSRDKEPNLQGGVTEEGGGGGWELSQPSREEVGRRSAARRQGASFI